MALNELDFLAGSRPLFSSLDFLRPMDGTTLQATRIPIADCLLKQLQTLQVKKPDVRKENREYQNIFQERLARPSRSIMSSLQVGLEWLSPTALPFIFSRRKREQTHEPFHKVFGTPCHESLEPMTDSWANGMVVTFYDIRRMLDHDRFRHSSLFLSTLEKTKVVSTCNQEQLLHRSTGNFEVSDKI